MQRTRPLLAVVLIAVGLIWVAQGTGVLRGGSFMVDDIRWAVAGALALVLGIRLIAGGQRRSSG